MGGYAMAIRRHFVLIPGSDREALNGCLEVIEKTPAAMAGGWCWTMASALAYSHRELRSCLEKSDRPFLLFTTFDGDGWELSASDGRGNVREAVHEFHEDWPAKKKGAKKRVDHLTSLILLVASQADSSVLRETLSGRAITEAEAESDLGDLPRLLYAIGAPGILEIPEDIPAGPVKTAPPKASKPPALIAGHEGRPKRTLEGLSLPIEHISHLAALALFCDSDAVVAILLKGQPQPDIRLDVPCQIRTYEDWTMVESDGGIGLKFGVIDRTVQQAVKLPGLEQAVVLAGRKRGGKDISWHRYAGPIYKGQWNLQEITPAVEAEVFKSAVILLKKLRTQEPVECDSEQEAKRVLERCSQSLFIPFDRQPGRNGLQLIPAEGTRLYVFMELFRARFAKTWETSASQKAETTEKKRWDHLEKKLEKLLESQP
jgi:hypothetical protein